MTAQRRQTIAARLAVLVVTCLICFAAEPTSAELLAGTAKRELTPPVRTPLAGYSRRHGKLATGIHDAPSVRALVLRDGQTMAALASCDLLIIDELLFHAVQRRLDAARLQPRPSLLLAATHTHSGPGAYGHKFLEKISMGHFNPAVFDSLAEQISQAILDAAGRLQPVTVASASAPAEGLIVNRMIPGGVVDPELSVAAFYNSRHELTAAIVNFAAHPTTLGAWNMRLSADYPGVIERLVEARHPQATCLFLVGAVGDQAPIKHGEEFERAESMGRPLEELAETLLGRLATQAAAAGLPLVATQRNVPLAPARVRLGRAVLPHWLGQTLVDDDALLTVVAVGRLLLLGVPCDLSAELGLALKQRAAQLGYRAMVVGFADDYIGYCLPDRFYSSGHYEALMAFNGPHTGSLLVGELTRMMEQLQ